MLPTREFTFNPHISYLHNFWRWIKIKLWNITCYGDYIEYKYFPNNRNIKGFDVKSWSILNTEINIIPDFLVNYFNIIFTPIAPIIINLTLITVSFILIIAIASLLINSLRDLLNLLFINKKIISQNSDDFMSKNLLVFYVHYLIFCLSYIFINSLFNIFVSFIFYVMLILIFLKFLQLFLIPTKLLYNMGYFYIVYVKGSGVGKLILWEYITDSISLLSFYLRSIIQLIRLVIIIGLLFTYHELYEYYSFSVQYSYFQHSYRLSNGGFSFTIIFFVKLITHWLYECIHFLILLSIQYSVFTLILLNLISFLYLQKIFESLEDSYYSHDMKWCKKLLDLWNN